jgi:SAM-dependent methyltransferase
LSTRAACGSRSTRGRKGVVCEPDSAGLEDGPVDLAFICDTYHHFEFPLKTMASLHRALRPGGRVVLIDFHRVEGKSSDWVLGHVRAGQEVFVKEIESAGSKAAGEEKFLKENYFVRFEKGKAGRDGAGGKP